jgi:hypothetical protein
MALKIGTDLKNYIVNQGVVVKMAGTWGTGGSASINIYTGAQPSTADGTASGTLLCTISNIGWSDSVGATGGTAALANTAGYVGTAATTGTAGWARLQTVGTGYSGSAATFRIDGDVGTAATCTFVINSASITALGTVTLLTAPVLVS